MGKIVAFPYNKVMVQGLPSQELDADLLLVGLERVVAEAARTLINTLDYGVRQLAKGRRESESDRAYFDRMRAAADKGVEILQTAQEDYDRACANLDALKELAYGQAADRQGPVGQ